MSVLNEPLHVNGKFSCKTLEVPAAYLLPASNARHRSFPPYSQADGTATAADSKVIKSIYGTTGSVIRFAAGVATACTGDSTITVDLHKNGSSILSSAITIDNGDSAYTPVVGTISNADLVQGDALEVVVTVNAGSGTLGQGLYAELVTDEDPS